MGRTRRKSSERKRKNPVLFKNDEVIAPLEYANRTNIADKISRYVGFSGELAGDVSNFDSQKSICFANLVIDGEFVDHMWLDFNVIERRKLKMKPKANTRVFMTGRVDKYWTRSKVGLTMKNVKLSVEL